MRRAALVVLCLLAVSCADESGDTGEGATSAAAGSTVDTAVSARPSNGIRASGGFLRDGPACAEPGVAGAAVTVKIAWVGPDLAQINAIGTDTLVLDDPARIVDAYTAEVNRGGGIGGNCFELVEFSWSVADPDSSFRQVCTDLPQADPLVLISLSLNNTTLRCATIGAGIPTIGLLTAVPEAMLIAAEGGLFVDEGSVEYLLLTSMNVADMAEEFTPDDRIGLLVTDSDSAASETETALRASQTLGLPLVETATVPAEFGTVGVLAAESEVRLMETGLSDAEIEEAVANFAALRPEQVRVLRSLEQFFYDTASEMRDSGVTVVVASANSEDVRRLMRSADQLDWTPEWLITDAQYAGLTLTRAPERQVRNLLQISARRAADDPITDLDRGCISLRNTLAGAQPFAHRIHTDAWSLTTSTCDYLDVVFGAITRIDGPLTHEALLEALASTDYETAQGSLIRFGPGDRNGSDRFRVLRADPDCVLNPWGCLRPTSGWFSSSDGP